MVANTLSKDAIEAGLKLLRKLDDAGLQITAVFWYFLPDSEVWRLILAPAVDVDGPKQVYAKIQGIIGKPDRKSVIALGDISVVDSKDPLVRLLRTAIHTGATISGIRFSRNTVNGHFIEDAYIYRLT
jgi:hypothetical protein